MRKNIVRVTAGVFFVSLMAFATTAVFAAANNVSIPELVNNVIRYDFDVITDTSDKGSNLADSNLTQEEQMIFEPVEVIDGWLFELSGGGNLTVNIGMLSVGERYIDVEGENGKVRYLQNSGVAGEGYNKTLFWSAKQQDGNSIVKDFNGEIKCVVLYEFPDGTCYLSGYIDGDGTDFWLSELPQKGYYRNIKTASAIENAPTNVPEDESAGTTVTQENIESVRPSENQNLGIKEPANSAFEEFVNVFESNEPIYFSSPSEGSFGIPGDLEGSVYASWDVEMQKAVFFAKVYVKEICFEFVLKELEACGYENEMDFIKGRYNVIKDGFVILENIEGSAYGFDKEYFKFYSESESINLSANKAKCILVREPVINPQITNYVDERELVRNAMNLSVDAEFALVEITPPDVLKSTDCRLVKIVDGSSWETFIIINQNAVHIGSGLGGFGVTSIVPHDVNNDGSTDLVYAYSWGSGIHRSVISWYDLKNNIEHHVNEAEEGFRQYDIILKIENEEIIVYRITEIADFDCLRRYPTEAEIEGIELVKESVLVYEEDSLYNKPFDR